MSTSVRFRDNGATIYSFLDDVLVVCPRCGGMAHVVRRDTFRLTCGACGHSRERDGRCMRLGANERGIVVDPYVGAALWLQLPTRHGRLWAYNLEHLAYIERYVAARLRERRAWYDTGQRMTLVARLPAWIKRANHRDEILRLIARLRRR